MVRVRRAKLALLACSAAYLGLLACSGAKFDSAPASGGTDAGVAGTKNRGGTDTGGSDANGGNATAGTGASAGSVTGGVTTGGNATGGNANEPSGGAATPEAGAGGAAPLDMPIPPDGLVYWFKADVGVHLDNGAVALWQDQSGNHYDATQSTPNSRPKKTTSNLLPMPIVAFDGADDFLNLPAFTPPLSSGLSFFIVTGRSQTSDCFPMLELSNGPEIDDISFDSLGNGFQFEVFADDVYSTMDIFPQGEVRLLETIQTGDPIQPMAELRMNGTSAGSAAVRSPVSILRSDNFIGKSLYANCPVWPGAMAELILYGRALGVDERVAVENYLKDKWKCCN